MKRVLLVHGMKRCGNHAIINWLLAHDRVLFCNDVILIGPILRKEEEIPAPQNFDDWLRPRVLPKGLRFAYRLKKPFLRHRSVIASLEDHELDVRPFRDVPCSVTNVLLVRDPWNLFASRIRKSSHADHPAYRTDEGMGRAMELWKSQAREFLGMTDRLENRVGISFDAWFTSADYRRGISAKLGLEFTDDGFSRVSGYGGGSSFDKEQFDGENRKMNVLNRKDHLEDSERRLLEDTLGNDEELIELAARLSDAIRTTHSKM